MSILHKSWFRLLVSLGLMALLLTWLVDWRQALAVLATAKFWPLFWLALWIVADRGLMAYKWRLLLVSRGMDVGHWEAFRAYFVATFAGCFLPSTVGGDALRVAAIRGPGRPSEVVAASVVMERALGFVAAVLAAMLSLVLLMGLAIELPRGFLGWSLGLLCVSALAVLFSLSGPAERLLSRLERLGAGRGKLAAWILRFLRSYHDYRGRRAVLAWFLLLSLLEQAVPVVGTWLAAVALDMPLSLPQSAAVAPLALLFTRVPVSVSGFGVVEGLYVAFFALVGLGPTHSFLLGLIANLSIVVATAPGAILYLTGGLALPQSSAARAAGLDEPGHRR